MSDSLRLHGLQHARLSCPSPTPGACSNSCPSSRLCHPTVSFSVFPFSSCLQYFPALGSFPKTLKVYLQITVHICKIQSRIWFLLSRSLKQSQTVGHCKHHMRHGIRIYVLVWISSGTVLSTYETLNTWEWNKPTDHCQVATSQHKCHKSPGGGDVKGWCGWKKWSEMKLEAVR